jgi:hypothetical protein
MGMRNYMQPIGGKCLTDGRADGLLAPVTKARFIGMG